MPNNFPGSSSCVMNTNVEHMKMKYGISHMIAAFPYEVIGLSNGIYPLGNDKFEGKMVLQGQTFPW
ncbi:hypothetical protein ACCD00_30860, partial [Pseudomonas sp. Pseusp3]|uniref:hypothetical protein n=1 Tax=Pseudomonas sp. Pseusp3 TaxID=3243029 RepID=UPI0039AEC084